jgi:hypothetical protein
MFFLLYNRLYNLYITSHFHNKDRKRPNISKKFDMSLKNKGYNLSVCIYNLHRKNNEKILYNIGIGEIKIV